MKIIAEIGTAHRGSLSRAEKLIRAAASSGADIAKFQIVFAREILHPETGTVPLPGGDTPLYEVFESLEKDLSFYASLKEMTEDAGMDFLASPFGMESAALLKKLKPQAVKIASPELNYTALLKEIASWDIAVILSSGVSTLEDLKESVSILGSGNLTLLHCVTAYPAPEKDYNLSVLPLLRNKIGVPVGVSDHSMNPSLIPSLSMLYSAVMIEKHFTLSRDDDGLDDPIALEPDDFYLMCSRVRELETLDPEQRAKRLETWFTKEEIKAAQGQGHKVLAPSEKRSYGKTNRSIHARFTLEAGTVLSPENCCVVRSEKKLTPGMHPRYFETIMGCRLKRTIPSGEGINEGDIMSAIIDPVTTFPMGDPHCKPFEGKTVSSGDLQKALDPLILSASGWRKVFAPDGNEESREASLNPADTLLAAAMAESYTDFLFSRVAKPRPVVVVGLDTRFTGPALGDVMIRVLLSRGIEVRYLFIAAAPELMGYTGQTPDCDGFIYISASHNPIGHNGVKFGLSTGGVLSGEEAGELIASYRELLADQSALETLMERCDALAAQEIEAVFKESPRWKKTSYAVYFEFSKRVMSGMKDKKAQSRFMDTLKKGIAAHPVAVVAELNGSARTLTVDKEFLEDLGVKVKLVNGVPRQITHRIVPEGESLDLCRSVLQEEASKDPAFQLGYVPDNDGDRGNLVFYSKKDGKAHILEAQEVFALSVLSELAYLYWSEGMTDKTGVAINGPTSARIEDICEAFGCSSFRAEVGEANVVNLAEKQRAAGWQIRILGEGSNGGNITWPAAVRDPLNTLGALLKLLVLRSTDQKAGLFEIWCHLSDQSEKYRSDFDLHDIIESLPSYTTTNAFEPRAIMTITGQDHGLLKRNYEEIFARDWEIRKAELFERFGVVSWEEWNQEGISSVQGVGSQYRSGAESGGLTIRFFDSEGSMCGFIWMRGSGTEPVFRVLADWKGDKMEAEAYFLDWHKQMIARADLA